MDRIRVYLLLAAGFLAVAGRGEEPVIRSFDGAGRITFDKIPAGLAYRVECATSLTGQWTRVTNAVTIDGIPTTMDCIPCPGRVGLVTGAVPVEASAMFFRTVAETNEMALIPAGSFMMGACTNIGFENYSDDIPQHSVYVSAFLMDRYEATMEKWAPIAAWATNHGYSFYAAGEMGWRSKASKHPMCMVLWRESALLCNARSEMEGLTPCYTDASSGGIFRIRGDAYVGPECNWTFGANGYRLPTEAEWEKAARGGHANHRFPWSDVDTICWARANYLANTNYPFVTDTASGYHPTYKIGDRPYSCPVDAFAPNGYGLYGMVGNMEEWCWDWYSSTYYSTSPGADPTGPLTRPAGGYKTLRKKLEGGRYGCFVRASDKSSGTRDIQRTFRSVRSWTDTSSNRSPVIAEGAAVDVVVNEDGGSVSLTLHAADADGNPLTWLAGLPAHGLNAMTGSGASRSFSYTPPANYCGGDAFDVHVYDGQGGTARTVVNVTVQPVNDAPVAYGQRVDVPTNTPMPIALTGSDVVEGSNLTYAVVTAPAHGVLAGAPPAVVYTPDAGYVGPDNFTFKVNDGGLDSAPATVDIHVGEIWGSGGTVTFYTSGGTNYTAHLFTNAVVTNLTMAAGATADVLVVAGGGGGGRSYGGGGGGGGMICTTMILTPGGYYEVRVGAGGTKASSSSNNATAGSNSVFAALTALGGGCASTNGPGGAGGSGSGGNGNGAYAGGAGTQPLTGGYGNDGGSGASGSLGGAGGGGGAGGAGGNGVVWASGGNGGNGGAGRSCGFSGVLRGYAGGGGGGTAYSGKVSVATDGGGSGTSGTGSDGAAATGGGGGGGAGAGGNGGSGIVIVRYATGP